MIKDKLVEGYGFIGTEPNTLYKFGNGKYKTFEGTEIVAENCVKAKVKDLVVEGKTIQDTEDLSNIESVAEKEGNVLSAKINDNTTTLNLPIPLRSLPNGVADTIEGNKLVQRVEKIILDGSNDENWKVNKSLYFFLNHSSTKTPKEFFNPNSTEYLNAISNISISHHTILDNKNGFGITYCYFWRLNLEEVDATKGATVDDLKSYLKENPVTVYYELETPIVHDLEIPSISTTKGTNVITTTNNIKPNLKIKVKVK